MKKNILIASIFLISILLSYNSYSYNELKYTVKDILIEFKLDDNTDYRQQALKRAYLTGIKRFLKWGTLKEIAEIDEVVSTINLSNFVTGYSIENEKFTKNYYSSLITVNFDKIEIDKLLYEKKIKFSFQRGAKTLLIPIMKFKEREILWDDPNPWFKIWINRPLDSNLVKFVIPEGGADDLILLNVTDAISLNKFKLRQISSKYDAEDILILVIDIKKNIKSEKLLIEFSVFNGILGEEVIIEKYQFSTYTDLNTILADIANKFADFYDNKLVERNIRKRQQESRVFIDISYTQFKDWIEIKNVLSENINVRNFKIQKISAESARIRIDILNKQNFLEDLSRSGITAIQDEQSWEINYQ